MFKGLGDLGKLHSLVQQARQMKEQIEAMKETLGDERLEATAGGGMVTVTMNGKFEVVSVKIDPEVINKDDPEMLETLVRAATNDAVRKVQELVKAKMTELAPGGFEIPGLT
ncbi:MAG: YbaB/EbfC family nucleoid-associated protein [Candidatus Hydrogenedentes bacterium]|nr:YbaB/EbfC family nucleoid-associated protein [Candidatus Hydrogenedentota bacterium]